MLSENNMYVLNLKKRPDRLLFTKIKMHRVGFDINKINFVTAVNGKEDKDCLNIFNRVNKLPKKNGSHQPINSAGAAGILKTYLSIFKDALSKNLDYVAMVEDDNYFHPDLIHKLRTSVNLLEKCHVVWVGSNQSHYSKEQLNSIKNNEDYLLDNVPIAGAFFIIFSKKIYTYLYDYLEKNFLTNNYPLDVLLDLILVKENIKATVLYPRPVIPEVRDSDNMGPREHIRFYQIKKMHNFTEYDCFNEYNIINKYYNNFDFNSYCHVYNKLKYYSIRGNKPIIGTLSYDNSKKLLESNYTTYNIIIRNHNNIELAIESVISQDYLYWRISIEDEYDTSDYKIYNEKIFKNIVSDNDEKEIILTNDTILLPNELYNIF